MKRYPVVILVLGLLGLPTMTGCGTVGSQIAGDPNVPVIYGGIVMDGWVIVEHPLVTPVAILDMPLSLVADTLLLPLTIRQQSRRNARQRDLE